VLFSSVFVRTFLAAVSWAGLRDPSVLIFCGAGESGMRGAFGFLVSLVLVVGVVGVTVAAFRARDSYDSRHRQAHAHLRMARAEVTEQASHGRDHEPLPRF
jgi:hypothetical protein